MIATYRMVLATLAAGLMMAGWACAQDKGTVTPTPRTDKAWMTRVETLNQRAKQGDVGLLIIGDSLVQGWEDKGKKPWDEFYPKRKGINLGIAGDTAPSIAWRLDHGNVDGLAPRLAIVMTGTDYGKDATAEEIADGMKAVVDKLREKTPRSRILMMAMLPRGAKDDPIRAVHAKANELIKKQADGKTVFYKDIGYAFLGDDGAVEKALMPDGVRLSEAGYQQLSDFMDSTIGSLLNETKYQTTPVPQANADWWYPYVKTLSARVKQGNVDMIFVGDSLCNGYVNTGKDTWEKYYAKRNAVNLGISTNNTQNELWQLHHGNIDGISPKLAVVLAASVGGTTEDATAGVKAVVDTLRTRLPQTKILLMARFPRGETKDFIWRVENDKVNAVISKLGDDETVFYMDINSKFMNADGTIKKELYRPDMVHLDTRGYAMWAEAIEPMVKKLMGEK